mgnify:CR=1 FL=1
MAENEDRSIDNPFLTRYQRQMRAEDEAALEESINTPEAQAILAEDELRRKNEERADQGLPPLPALEEEEESNEDIMRRLRERSARKAIQLPTTYAQAPLAADADDTRGE